MKFSYTIAGGAVRIDRVEEPQQIVIIPDNLDGYPVTELGDYALAGSSLEEIWLPTNLKKIGAYGFYNCERLRCLHCSSRTIDLGTGLFAGAGSVEVLDMELFEGEKSCLKELLSELRQTLRVRLRLGENGGEARLIFPEYYEESVENTPARILYIETHGCGHRYRYCFGGTEFEYQKYDELFPHVKVQEPEDLVTELEDVSGICDRALEDSRAAVDRGGCEGWERVWKCGGRKDSLAGGNGFEAGGWTAGGRPEERWMVGRHPAGR